jgi:hypothetical protein
VPWVAWLRLLCIALVSCIFALRPRKAQVVQHETASGIGVWDAFDASRGRCAARSSRETTGVESGGRKKTIARFFTVGYRKLVGVVVGWRSVGV